MISCRLCPLALASSPRFATICSESKLTSDKYVFDISDKSKLKQPFFFSKLPPAPLILERGARSGLTTDVRALVPAVGLWALSLRSLGFRFAARPRFGLSPSHALKCYAGGGGQCHRLAPHARPLLAALTLRGSRLVSSNTQAPNGRRPKPHRLNKAREIS